MQAVNGAQFLDINFLLVSFIAAPTPTVFGTVTVSLTCMHHYNHINLTLLLKF